MHLARHCQTIPQIKLDEYGGQNGIYEIGLNVVRYWLSV